MRLTRRTALAGLGASLARRASAAPVAVTILDVGGALALMQPAFEAFRSAHPDAVARLTFTKAPAPELAA